MDAFLLGHGVEAKKKMFPVARFAFFTSIITLSNCSRHQL